MNRKSQKTKPLARSEKLLVRELPDEVLVYDQANDRAHCLNETAAFVWKKCNGRNTIRDIALSLGKRVNATVDEDFVWLALDRLAENNLLKRHPAQSQAVGGMNRRHMMRALGLTAVVALPLVTSIVAPTAAEAATCLPSGAGCGSSPQCCSGLCNAGTCA